MHKAQGTLPMIFKPFVTLFTSENLNNSNIISVKGEPIQVSVQLLNPLHILLYMKDIFLLWEFTDSASSNYYSNEVSDSSKDQFVRTHIMKSFILQANATQNIILTITPMAMGNIRLKGICYSLIGSNNVSEDTIVKGKQVFHIETVQNYKMNQSPNVPSDVNINVTVVPPAPCLQVILSIKL